MHWLDTTLLAFFGLALVLGFMAGFFWQVARLVGLTLSVYVSWQFHGPIVSLMHSTLLKGVDENVAKAVSYIVVFIGAYLAIFLLCRWLRELLKASGLDLVDRLLGSMLSLGKMALVLGGICLLMANVAHPAPQRWMKESTIAPVLAQGMEKAWSLVPEEYRRMVINNAHGAAADSL